LWRWTAKLLGLLFGLVRRWWQRLGRKTRWRIKLITAAVVLTSPVWVTNLAVSFFGHSVVFPLSPYFLREKISALGAYARHRPKCVIFGHEDTDALVRSAEARHHLPRGLLAAVVHVESRGRPHRISSAGAMGPGQLMPGTARQLGVEDPYDSAQNIDGAARLLASHVSRFNRIRLAVAAYNAGPGAVRGRVPQNGQTPEYVSRVMHAYARLRPPPPPLPNRKPPASRRPTAERRGAPGRALATADDLE
jgi:hypothetical protein